MSAEPLDKHIYINKSVMDRAVKAAQEIALDDIPEEHRLRARLFAALYAIAPCKIKKDKDIVRVIEK